MAAKFKFLLIYFLSWVVFFDLLRIVFLIYHFDKTKHLSFNTILSSFWYGFRMDISVAAYIIAPVCLFVLLSLFIHFFRRLFIYKAYTFIVLLLIALISFFDLEIYNQWGFRIDSTPLKFLSTPREAFASVSHLPLFFLFIIFIICYALFYFCFKYILRKIFFQQQNKYRIATALVILLFMGCLIIPIRGGFQLAPLNQSSVYFSTNNYANHAAINASWNFLHSVVSKGASGKNPYQYLSAQQAKETTDSLYSGASTTEKMIKFSSDTATNVIFVIWESFTEKAIHLSIDSKEVTPQFNRLKKEGIYFSNVYASGDRTNKGIPAILSGYPAMPNTTIIHSPGKSEKLQVLSKLFKEKGYYTPFFYGGEPEFANIKSYLLHGGFDPIIGKEDFASKDMNSKWGAHDGVVMNRVFENLNNVKKPFFATWLTLTSHEPFEIPVSTVL
jgi:phosphoglycerol transferase MdoB-like AlkP superfamily enzyme